jgi:class 3 adenylate cyclase/tetratricopeptide (TPR) repeat protein
MKELDRLAQAISHLESQRSSLGDEVVDAALLPLREKLAEIEAQGDFPAKQRKQVTILFADIVNSTGIAAHLDPEDTRDLFDGTLQRLAQCVEAHNGHVTRFTGDGFKAVFGSPQAHENDPEQAVRAGLDIQEAAKDLASELRAAWQIEDFHVRVGINTGMVAVGGTVEAEDMVVGSPVNLAKRIESAASPGGLLISHNTYRHVRGIFDVQQLEPITVKGFDQPIPIYLVQRPKTRALRIYLRGVEGIETRMVGRDAELKLLKDALHRMINTGAGKVITILGEAGIGKSRLAYEFDKWVELLPPPNVRIFQGRGRAETQSQPNSMLREMFAFRFEILDSDSREVVLMKLERGFGEIFGFELPGQKRAHIIGQLLGFDCQESLLLKDMLDPRQLHELAREYLLEYFYGLTAAKPTIVYLEDMHWIDDSSLDLIAHLSKLTPQNRLLIICLARKIFLEQYPSWGIQIEHYTCLDLKPLSKSKSRQLVDEILQKMTHIPEGLSELVVNNAEGNPFYIEELIKMLVESGVILKGDDTWWVKQDLLDHLEIPPTLRGVLQARLDGLPAAERNVLQLAAVLGKDFWDDAIYQVGQASAMLAEEDLKYRIMESLTSMNSRELIYPRDESTFANTQEYRFKHILFRDVTYETIPKRDRRDYHGLSADWLVSVTQASQRSDEYATVIADHYLQAEQNDMASDWFFRSGLHAKAQIAMREAQRFLTQALELLSEHDLENRWRVLIQRDEIRGILGDIEGRKADDQMLVAIAEELEDDTKLARAYCRLGFFYNSRGDYEKELLSYEKALQAARKANDRQLETSILGLKVVSLTFLGEMEQARQSADLALKYARKLKDEDTLAKTLGNVVVYYQLVDIMHAVQLIEESIQILDRLGEHNLKASSLINLGYIYTQCGQWEQAENTFKNSLELVENLENPRLIAYNQLNLGLTYHRQGKHQQAREILEKTLTDCQRVHDNFACAAGQIYLGLTLERLEEWDLAAQSFTDAWDEFNQLRAAGFAMEALAGRARCALEAGQHELAMQFALELCDYLQKNGSQGMEFPILAYVTCASVFEKTGDEERRQKSIEKGMQQLMEMAEKISDARWRKVYLEQVPEHNNVLLLADTINMIEEV